MIQAVFGSQYIDQVSIMLPPLLLSIFLNQASSSSSLSFSFSSFNNESCSNGSLICTGSVTAYNGFLSLISESLPGNSTSSPSLLKHRVGWVFYSLPVLAWPATISTTFTIRISPYPNAGPGDDMSFIFATNSNPSPPDSDGSFLGIMSRSPQGLNYLQLAVELDTFKNGFDPDQNHIGIDTTNMTKPLAVTSLDGAGIELKSGRLIKVQIDYDGFTNMLYVSMSYYGYPTKEIVGDACCYVIHGSKFRLCGLLSRYRRLQPKPSRS